MRVLRRVGLIRIWWGCIMAVGTPLHASAQDVPFLSGRVNDQAGLIADDREEALEQELRDFEVETGSQIVVLTVADLGGTTVEQYALEVAETWALGRDSVDDGVLFLISRDDRKLRIEVGYGLEGSLTDAESRRILDWVVVPAFREGEFSDGIAAGTRAVMDEIRGTVPTPEGPPAWMTESAESRRAGEIRIAVIAMLLFAAFVLFLMLSARRRGRRRRAWSSRTGWGRPPIIVHGPNRRRSTKRSSSTRRQRPRRSRPRSPSPRRSSGFGGSFRGGGGSFGGGGASSGW